MYTTLPSLDIRNGDKVYDCSITGYWLRSTLYLAAKMKRLPSEKDELLQNAMQKRMKLDYIGITIVIAIGGVTYIYFCFGS